MVRISDIRTEAASSVNIRNRTSRLNRSSEAMKSAKENGYDSSGGGPANPRRGGATLHELGDHQQSVEDSLNQANQANLVERLVLEDASSTHSNPPDLYEMTIHQQPTQHRTPRQHQLHPKPPHHVVPITHHKKQEQSKESTSPKQWGKNIEESINVILKRLDQLTGDHENNDKYDGGKKNALTVPQVKAGQSNHHRDMTSERLQHNKDKERMAKRIEELEKTVERLTNENCQWKTRLEDLVAENRHLQLVKYPADELKSRSSVLMTDIKGRPSVVLADQTVKRNDAAWMSLWNVLPHVGGPNSIEANTFQQQHPEILLRCLQINLQHKKKAMERTKRLLIDRNIDIALIQEPYALGTGVPEMYGVPAGYTAFHNLTEHHTSGAAVIAKNTLRAKMCTYSRNDIAGIQLRSGNKTYHFYSVFCRPSSLNLSSTLMPLLEQAPPTLVIGMDASAKHPKWNNGMVYRKIDQRGRELERLLNQYDMHLASPPLYKLKYVPENYTFIDVTLGGEDIQFHDWKFWEDSLSDHPYVFFQVE